MEAIQKAVKNKFLSMLLSTKKKEGGIEDQGLGMCFHKKMHIGMYKHQSPHKIRAIQNFKCSRHPIIVICTCTYTCIISQGESSPVAGDHLEDFALLVHQPAVTLASAGCG